MQAMTQLILALLLPCCLGSQWLKPFVKKRPGERLLRWGAGYILGYFVVSLILRAYTYLQRPFAFYEIALILFIATLLAWLFLRVRPCSVGELRPAVSPPPFLQGLIAVLLLLLLARLVTIGVDVVHRPLLPWDAWYSWSAKAKAIFYAQTLPDFDAFYKTSQFSEGHYAVGGTRHPNFLPLVQAYVALAYGSWQDSYINLPWLGLGLALALVIMGGLRYLGMIQFLSVLAAYLVLSLPMLDAQVSLGSYAGIWVASTFSVVVVTFIAGLQFKEFRLLWVSLAFLSIMVLTKETAVMLLPIIAVVFLRYFLSNLATVVAISLLVFGFVLLDQWVSGGILGLINRGLGMQLRLFSLSQYQDLLEPSYRQLIYLDNWHYLFLLSLFSAPLLFLPRANSNFNKSLEMLTFSGLACLGLFIWLSFFTPAFARDYLGYVNRVVLYFAPILTIMPVCLYQLSIGADNQFRELFRRHHL